MRWLMSSRDNQFAEIGWDGSPQRSVGHFGVGVRTAPLPRAMEDRSGRAPRTFFKGTRWACSEGMTTCYAIGDMLKAEDPEVATDRSQWVCSAMQCLDAWDAGERQEVAACPLACRSEDAAGWVSAWGRRMAGESEVRTHLVANAAGGRCDTAHMAVDWGHRGHEKDSAHDAQLGWVCCLAAPTA
jgi:hypothetical protein